AAARRLTRPSARKADGLFLVEGRSAVSAGLAAGRLREVFVGVSARARHDDLLVGAGVPIRLVSDEAVASLSETVTPQGIVGVAAINPTRITDLARPRMVAVLVEVRDPGNAGTVVRTADAAGADAVVFAGDCVDPWGGKSVRASAGSVFHLPLITGVGFDEAVAGLRAAGCRLVATAATAETDLDAALDGGLLAAPMAWLFGNEAHGLSVRMLAVADQTVRVPVYGRAESLNLATAAAVCLYATARAQKVDGSGAGGGGRR
ncbi:MAG: TrmH family RNA methyltransferase, partial [Frankia sp.]